MIRSLYAAFDRYPSSKGAATHIEQTIAALFAQRPQGLLLALGDHKLAESEDIDNGKILRFHRQIPNLIQRAEAFGEFVSESVAPLSDLEIVHFRDPWSGIPLLESTPGKPKFVYEVNGLPSIELPYHFNHLPGSLLSKVEHLENQCLETADIILTPSRVIYENLVSRNRSLASKITVIPNGAVLPPDLPRPVEAPENYILYFGALQQWQGIGTMLRAFAETSDLDIQLVICSSNKPRFAKPWMKLCGQLGIEHRVTWKSQLTRPRLQAWVQHAMMTLAPLTESPRNIDQGCCPLKILESLAAGVPVIASDLPVVREITDQYLIRPDRPGAMACAIRCLHDHSDLRAKLGKAGKQLVAEKFTWESHRETLAKIYTDL